MKKILKASASAMLLVLIPLGAWAHEVGHHAELEQPGLVEIVGGIGWIVGILGFIAYLKSRRGK